MTSQIFLLCSILISITIVIALPATSSDDENDNHLTIIKEKLDAQYADHLQEVSSGFQSTLKFINKLKIEKNKKQSDCVLKAIEKIYLSNRKVKTELSTCYSDARDNLKSSDKVMSNGKEAFLIEFNECCQNKRNSYDTSVAENQNNLNTCIKITE
ncbi:uncharacterized protein LOC122858185 [Aphidius gifuensis]|uniref:uncharacterized protein LOC122858185 n=1 Tax=Aphidius gifuensis TaxID=684658 RepID=UPI001CDB48B5|nr:uncharacterized protein LOC122858185 [Aphidius gifuensis]